MSAPSNIWVIDTSSLIDIRRHFEKPIQLKIFDSLSELVEAELLVYPKQVLDELERYQSGEDLVYAWACDNEALGCKVDISYDALKVVLDHPQVRHVFDPDKTIGVEEADPYVLALALQLKQLGTYKNVIVLTQEKNDTPVKLSLSSACALLELIPLAIKPFLIQRGILAQ